MQSIRRSLLTFVLLMLCALSFAQLNFIRLDSIQQRSLRVQANGIAKAFVVSDYEAFVKFTYPKAVQMLGGEAKMIEILEKGIQEMKSQGVSFKSVSIGENSDVAVAGNELHTYIVQTIEMEVPNGTLIANSHLLAITKDNGKTWHFIDSSPLSKESVREIVPNYNFALKIPDKQKPIFNPAQ